MQVLTSDIDRHLIVLGSDTLNANGTARTGAIDPLLIAFSDQENLLEFESKATNTAGSLRISSGSLIVGGLKQARNFNLDRCFYALVTICWRTFYFWFKFNKRKCWVDRPKAVVNADNGIYWMASDGFYFYNGSVHETTVFCFKSCF